MERNEETLSTRDLASANDPVTGTAAASDTAPPDVDRSSDAPAEVYDRELADRETGDPEALSAEPRRADASAGDVDLQSPRGVPEEKTPASPAGPSHSAAGNGAGNGAPLLPEELSVTFQERWEEVQTRFVDEPRGAVEEADGLVANLMQQLAEGFAQERERLEAQWGRGEDISTEDLRIALQRYRSFFQRLLST
ncbi:MAG: hypothetical protein ACRDPA_30040 [Solirubrobacteraceae bacterium]